MTTTPKNPVVAALAEQVACYRKLAKLAELQHSHVQNSQTERLLDVLRGRQQLLDQLAGLERVIGPAKNRWGDFAQTLPAEARELAEAMLTETRTLLEKITAADRDDVMALQQQKIGVGHQIQRASAAKKLNRNYAAAAYGRAAPRLDLQR